MRAIECPSSLAWALREMANALDDLPDGFYVAERDCPGSLCLDIVNRHRTLGLGVCVCDLNRGPEDTLRQVAKMLENITAMYPKGSRGEDRGAGG